MYASMCAAMCASMYECKCMNAYMYMYVYACTSPVLLFAAKRPTIWQKRPITHTKETYITVLHRKESHVSTDTTSDRFHDDHARPHHTRCKHRDVQPAKCVCVSST